MAGLPPGLPAVTPGDALRDACAMTEHPRCWTWRPVRLGGRCQIAIFAGHELHALLHPHRLDEAWAVCRRRNARQRGGALMQTRHRRP